MKKILEKIKASFGSDKDNQSVTLNDYSLHDERRKKLLRQLKRRNNIKRIVIGFFYFLLIIGAVRGCTFQENDVSFVDNQVLSFTKEYSNHFYTLPKEEEQMKYLKKFTLTNNYSEINELKKDEKKETKVRIRDVSIIQVKSLSDENTYRFFCKGILNNGDKDYLISYSMDIYIDNNKYLVLSYPIPTTKEFATIKDKEKFKSLIESEKGSESVQDTTEIENTIDLFLTTYSNDYAKSKLLTTTNSTVDRLDTNSKVELLRVTSATSDKTYYYVETSIKYTFNGLVETEYKCLFKIQKDNNKIEKMEVL